jgi:hypothetical protein
MTQGNSNILTDSFCFDVIAVPSAANFLVHSSPMNFPHFVLVSFKSSSLICVVAGNSSIQWYGRQASMIATDPV